MTPTTPFDRNGATLGLRGIVLAVLALVLAVMAVGPNSALADEAGELAEPQLLVGNLNAGATGASGIQRALNGQRPGFAQAFTTGPESGGYTLASLGFQVSRFDDLPSVADDLQVTINSATSDGGPGEALCTLSHPSSLVSKGVNVFVAPSDEGACPTLAAETTYIVVIEWLNRSIDGSFALIPQTLPTEESAATEEDPGSAEGWSIADRSQFLTVTGSVRSWSTYPSTASFKIVVRGTTLPSDGESDGNSAATGKPTISGTLQVDETLTADTVGIHDDDGLDNVSYSYQWLAGGEPIDGATGSSYTLTSDQAGQAIEVRVTFTDDAGNEETLTSDPTEPVADRPNNSASGSPTINGILRVGQTLTVSTSGIEDDDGLDDVSYRYQWLAGGEDIPDATSSSFTLTSDEEGQPIQVRVSFTDDRGHAETLTSDPTPSVAAETAANNPATGQPTISGAVQVGETLTADTSAIADDDGLPAELGVIWRTTDANGVSTQVKTSYTNNFYTLRAEDKGKTVSVEVRFTDLGGTVEVLHSDPTEAVAGGERTSRPHDLTATVSGNTIVLAWTDALDGPDFNQYQILRHRPELGEPQPLVYVNLQSADPTYTDTEVEPGVLYAYQVKAVVDWFGFFGEASESAEVRIPNTQEDTEAEETEAEPINTPPEGRPTITGTTQVGETLTALTSGIEDDDGLDNVSYDYQWIGDGTPIPDATGSSYTLTADEEGQTIQVQVSFSDDAGNEELLTSDPTSAVAAAPALAALTVSAQDVPASHDGQNAFSFEIRFSEEPRSGLSYQVLKLHAFTVTDGTLQRAQRLQKEPQSNIGWRITVQPTSNADVTVVLPVTVDCSAQGAICTEDGRKLSERLEINVAGPGE